MRWLVAAACATGCSLAVDSGRTQCSADSDCTKRGAAFADSVCRNAICIAPDAGGGGSKPPPGKTHTPDAGPAPTVTGMMMDGGPTKVPMEAAAPLLDWSCMDQPKVVTPEPGPFHVSFKLSNIADMKTPPKGVQAQRCGKLDPDCSTPLGKQQISDADGVFAFDDVDKTFAGYVTLNGAGFTPGLYFFNPPVDRALDAVAVQMITPGVVTGLISLLKSVQDPNGGIILMNVADCQGKAASGVSYAADVQNAVRYYSLAGLPSTAGTETDTAGFGGFINVAQGTVPLTATIVESGRQLPPLSVFVRAGAITYVKLVPLGR